MWTGEEDLLRPLVGRSTTDTDDWKPDMDEVRAMINFTLATERFEHNASE
jgi:hypothetical protein